MVLAWIFNASDDDQREPHKMQPNQEVSLKELEGIGVEYFRFDVDGHENNPEYSKLRSDRGYSYEDVISVSPTTLPNYEQKIKSFFEEHLHTDEEIRFCLDGSGYFDVRDTGDKWIRIELEKGDLIVLPAGIYHRFTLDSKFESGPMTTRLINDIKFVLAQWRFSRIFNGAILIFAVPKPETVRAAIVATGTENYIKAKRLFIGEPVWTPHNRPCDQMTVRRNYVNKFL